MKIDIYLNICIYIVHTEVLKSNFNFTTLLVLPFFLKAHVHFIGRIKNRNQFYTLLYLSVLDRQTDDFLIELNTIHIIILIISNRNSIDLLVNK